VTVIFCGRCVPCCVWRACGGVCAVLFAQCAVVVAARDVVRACGALFVLCVCVCVRVCVMCGACFLACAVLGVTRAMTMLACRSGGRGLSCRVCACARVFAV
jgi:hypothetical protein